MKKALFAVAMVAVAASNAGAQVAIYSRVPATLAPTYTSIGFQATGTKELGDYITFGVGPRTLQSATVTMVNWSYFGLFSEDANWNGNASSFSVPLTMNLYNVGVGNSVGSLIATRSITANIAWRPQPSVGCTGNKWLAPDGVCKNGAAQNVTFDFSGTVVPDDIIFGVAYNTQNHGYVPTGVSGPYDMLNIGARRLDVATVGSDGGPAGALYRNSADINETSSTPNQFSSATYFGEYSPMVEFVAASTVVPEPSTYALMVAGLAGLLAVQRRRRSV